MLQYADVYLGSKRIARVQGLNHEKNVDAANKAIEMARQAFGLNQTYDVKVELHADRRPTWLKGWPRLMPTGVGMDIALKNGIMPREAHVEHKPHNANELVEALETPKTSPHGLNGTKPGDEW